MGQIKLFRKRKSKKVNFPRTEQERGFRQNKLIPIKLSGVVVPSRRKLTEGTDCRYMLVCSGGLEYYFVTSENWSNVLSRYVWEDVKVIGLLNTSDFTLIPQKIYPKGPTGELEKIVDLARWKSQFSINQVTASPSDLMRIPAAAEAV